MVLEVLNWHQEVEQHEKIEQHDEKLEQHDEQHEKHKLRLHPH